MQDFLGTDNSVIDNTFFDNTNTESFANKKLVKFSRTITLLTHLVTIHLVLILEPK